MVARRRLRRILALLLLTALYLGGRWGWDALHPPSVARWQAAMAAGAKADKVIASSDDYAGYLHAAEPAYLAALKEAQRFGRGDARLAQTQFALADMYDTLWNRNPAGPPLHVASKLMRWVELRTSFDGVKQEHLAEYFYRQALDTYAHSSNPDDPRQVLVLDRYISYCGERASSELATNHEKRKYPALEETLRGRIVTIAEKVDTGWDAQTILCLMRDIYYWYYADIGKAETLCSRVVQVLEPAQKPDEQLLEALSIMTNICCEQNRDSEAMLYGRKMIQVAGRMYKINTDQYASVLLSVGETQHYFHQDNEAMQLYLNALRIYQQTCNFGNALHCCVDKLCPIYETNHRFQAEEMLIKQCFTWLERKSPQSKYLDFAYNSLNHFYQIHGMTTKEEVMRQRQIVWLEHYATYSKSLNDSYSRLIQIYNTQGMPAKAQAIRQRQRQHFPPAKGYDQ